MNAHEKIARILRVDKDAVRLIEDRLGGVTGKRDVIQKIAEENDAIVDDRLRMLGLRQPVAAKDAYDALIKKMEQDTAELSRFLGNPSPGTPAGCETLLDAARKVARPAKGFFLTQERARALLLAEPPQKIINTLGYRNAEELLRKEDLWEVWSALRFIEGGEWLNEVFFKQYDALTPNDFEERDIVLKTLGPKWSRAARPFVKKKYHNISHLKELGVLFIIPIALELPGEVMRNFNLLLHYLNEIPFYSSLIRGFAADGKPFAPRLISLLRGDVIDYRPPPSKKSQWLVIQRYLAKDDENDWRLFEPHVNPEALHWERAMRMLVTAGDTLGRMNGIFTFWENLSWVGDFFKTETGIDVLVGLNLVDTAMSLVGERELVKYLYHHQEALWNKIFTEYFGEEKMEEYMRDYLFKGWFEV